MAYYSTTVTPIATGILTINNGFQAQGMRITVSSGPSATAQTTAMHLSIGTVDNSGWMTYHTIFEDASGRMTKSGVDKMVSHLARVSGTISEVCAAVFDSFNATDTKINVTKVTTAYQYHVEVWD